MTARLRSRSARWVVIITLALGLSSVAAAVFLARVPPSTDILRQRVVRTLSERLDAEVELGDLSFSAIPRLRVEGTNLTVRQKHRHDVPPLISIQAFSVDTRVGALWRRHIERINLVGLDIQIPPNEESSDSEATPEQPAAAGTSSVGRDFVIDELVADHAKLTINPRQSDRKPKVWQMHELHIRNVGAGQRMPFHSVLTNAVPPGEIATSGTFGPWNVGDPGRTPLDGTFTFDRADLSVFSGISGILSARGSYSGSVERIKVHGETDTPDFMVKISGHPVPLKTVYHAVVDGTNGNTTLERIDASFLATALVAVGGVFDVKGVDGRLVTLDITIDKGRLEDLMRLAVSTPKPPMTGALRLKTKFDLPPGPQDVVEKLKLNGQFAITAGRFTNADVQTRINELSQRARGKRVVANEAPTKVTSDFSGSFRLGNGTLALQKLTFDVPGAVVEVNGQYGLRRETLAFSGNLVMDAKLSQTTSGFRSLLLKIVDPLFRRNGRTVVPIRINGTRNDPSFGLDVGRVFKR